ncbi:MAG: ABC transporter ATP-binding protein [Granulosicoccus sp.]
MADVALRQVDKRFGKIEAIRQLDLDIADGEFVVLLGPTGAGKTTTLRLVAGLEKPESGSVYIDGADVTGFAPSQRDVSFVFQQYSLYPHLTVRDNLAFPLKSPAHSLSKDEIRKRVEYIADLVQIGHKIESRSTQLSGGEMQRVAIGRALVRDPAIYLMDEPLSSLDAKLRADLRLELKRIQSELGATMLYVTHDQVEAMTMADRIGILAEGELVQVGTPREIYEDPVNLHVAARLGQPSINLLPVSVFGDLSVPAGTTTIGLRTEHLQVSTSAAVGQTTMPAGQVAAILDRIEHLGDQNRLHLHMGEHRLVTLGDGELEFKLSPGSEVLLQVEHPLYFDKAGQRVR